MLVQVGFALGAFAAVRAREERSRDGVPLDVCVQRVTRGECRVAEVALKVAYPAVRFDVVFQGRFRLHLKSPFKNENYLLC